MTLKRGIRARVVASRRTIRRNAGRVQSRLSMVSDRALECGTRISTGVGEILQACAAAAAPRIGYRPAVESLECRQLLSAVSFSNGVLTLTGDTSASNSLTVDVVGGGNLSANADGHALNVAASSVNSISITGGSGSDWIYINPQVTAPASITTFDATGAATTIRSGTGNDTITTGNGNDLIYGSGTISMGNGNDVVWVGNIGSKVQAGNGSDVLIGGGGNDTLISGSGQDTLIGGGGSNTLQGGANTSYPNAGPNDTIIKGTTPTPTPIPTSPAPVGQTASVSFSNGVLSVTGDATAANSLTVDLVGGSISANSNGHALNVAPSSVQSISITGGSGADWIYINPQITVSATINTFDGNDTIRSGTGNDTITVGNGGDLIYGSGTITLGNGNNVVWVGAIGSKVQAGSGSNVLIGGPGNDTLIAGNGQDTLIGGGGSNLLQGGSNTSYPNVGPGDTIGNGTVASPPPAPAPTPTPTPTPTPPPTTLPAGAQNTTITGSNNGDSQAPVPVINILGTSGQTEHSVFVDALSSQLVSGTPLTATYQWNFGDSGSRFNSLTGWNAGHIYNNPGVYTVTLKVTNAAGHSSTLSTQVTIVSSTRTTIYVDTNGNDSNSGLSPSQPVASLVGVQALLTKYNNSNVTVLFDRGETFNFPGNIDASGTNEVFSSYGNQSSPAPVLMKVTGWGLGIFGLDSTSNQVVIENLTFDSAFPAVNGIAPHITGTGVYTDGTNVTIRNNTFLNMDNAVDSYRGPTGLLLQDNSAPLATGLRGYFDWMNGSEQVILGNYVANSTREHDIRSSYTSTSTILIAGNTFDNPPLSSDPNDTPKTTINIRAGSYVYITNNTLLDGAVSFGPDDALSASTQVSWIKLDGNVISNAQTYLHGSVVHAMVSNNLMTIELYPHITLDTTDDMGRQMNDVTIANNTGTMQTSVGSFLQINGNSPSGIITVKNNLFAAPNLIVGDNFATSVFVNASNAASVSSFSHNVWAAANPNYYYLSGAVNFIAASLDSTKFLTGVQWNSLGNVQDDQFRQVAVSGTTNLQVAIDGQMAGAVLPAPLS